MMTTPRWWRHLLAPPHGAHVQQTRRATFIESTASQAAMRATLKAPGREKRSRYLRTRSRSPIPTS